MIDLVKTLQKHIAIEIVQYELVTFAQKSILFDARYHFCFKKG